MKLKYTPVLAFALLTAFQSPAHAIFKWLNNLAHCEAWTDSPEDRALADYDRMSTPLPAGAFRKVVPFQESDFRTKPWMREYEYVVVVNNESPYLHKTEFPAEHPIPYSAKQLGLTAEESEEKLESALRFQSVYGAEARKVYYFGTLVREKDSKGKLQPVRSHAPDAQTVRVYRRGQLVHMAKISTGRGGFELRDKNPRCTKRPDKSYYSITEPGYYNFQELVKSGYKSGEWNDAEMPNAMFYLRGRGLALHEVSLPEKIAALGTRASGGCTRMDPTTASTLFDWVKETEGAVIPVLDIYGRPVLDAAGRLQYKDRETIIYGEGTRQEQRYQAKSYSALLIIQPDSVVDASSAMDRAVFHRYQP